MTFVLVSFGREVGIGPTLSAALQDVLSRTVGDGATPAQPPATEDDGQSDTGSGGGQDLPRGALRLLQQADQKFAEADRALRAGDLEAYAKSVNQARALVEQALAAKK